MKMLVLGFMSFASVSSFAGPCTAYIPKESLIQKSLKNVLDKNGWKIVSNVQEAEVIVLAEDFQPIYGNEGPKSSYKQAVIHLRTSEEESVLVEDYNKFFSSYFNKFNAPLKMLDEELSNSHSKFMSSCYLEH